MQTSLAKCFVTLNLIMAKSDVSLFAKLNLPPALLDVERLDDGRFTVYDRWRGRRVALTPEEWVRQHFVSMLVDCKGYLSGRIANEISIRLNGTDRRCDTVVYDGAMRPLMIIEYKAPDVKVTQAVFDQIARYAMVLRAPYLAVSNGLCHYCCRMDYDGGTYEFLKEIPDYLSML